MELQCQLIDVIIELTVFTQLLHPFNGLFPGQPG